ncbi:MAG: amidohydrolase family protein [Bosea sp. (in: a-proteobacteria)]|uniref:metal-dependent hydrolase family protein n=1 Tax=Bosea sp. (in: a-proteobacteria) TaxID=1871050 RepID=UPI0027322C3F|nr:amidohydrolase family protein [Bosea sp. (in: a-proteobacteria)]MDP3258467.1 amidohydrolase family protein [Bosea sp. (in: a-proteobacteria)]MDP3318943.1 amidohydrolase family protein [Bosea sp. (in: a-proteobacteria)]
MARPSRRNVLAGLSTLALGLPPAAKAQGSPAVATGGTVFRNVRIFDGHSGVLSAPSDVLVKGNVIDRIATDRIGVEAGITAIEGGGRTLMPGLTDMHWHAMLVRSTPAQSLFGNLGFNYLTAGAEATDTLMRGFTTIRDMGGPSFGLKQAIDGGVVPGPRIYPSGAVITVTSGHGDFRQLTDLPRKPGTLSRMEEIGGSMVADSPGEVRMRVREQLMQGASQIKLTAGGGVASPFSPLDVSTFTADELRAAVAAADNWGTYVAVHAYTPAAIARAIDVGVKCIEHGHLMDEATARLIADKDIWLSTQAFPDEIANAFPPGSFERQKAYAVVAGTEKTFELAKKHKLKLAFGTDILFSAQLATRHGELLAKLGRWFTPAEALTMATGTNAKLLAMSGLRNPYPGKLGVVEPGALADLLLVDGNPLENLGLVADPRKNFVVIMKDGRIYKNTLPG